MKSLQYLQRIIPAIVCLMIVFAASAQYVTDNKRAGDQFYTKGDYYSAAKYYEKYLDKNKKAEGTKYEPYQVQKQGGKKGSGDKKNNRPELLYRLGDSYHQLNDHTHAEQWYAVLLQEDPTAYPLARYYYGVSLRANKKYGESQQQLEQFVREYNKDDIYTKEAKRELVNLQFIQAQLASPAKGVSIATIGSETDHSGADYAAVLLNNNNTVVFTSTYSAGTPGTNLNSLYSAGFRDNKLVTIEKLGLPVPGKTHDGAAAFTPDGNKIFFTRWQQEEKNKRLIIYSSEKVNNNWSEPVQLNNNINLSDADSKQPAVTADGKYLLFSSNRAGGPGGFDIWYAPLDKGVPGKAMVVPVINTADDDEAPFYHAATQTLIFSSKGRTGMGGFDLFSSKGNIGSSFSEPVNLGYPVNSVKDDIYFTSTTDRLLEEALISSDRDALCCLELFAVHKKYTQYFTGKVIDCATSVPVSDAEVVVTDQLGKRQTLQTNNDGIYSLQTNEPTSLQVSGSKASYETNTISVQAEKEKENISIGTLCLTKKADPFKGEKKLVTQEIYFKFNKTAVTPDSYGYLDEIVTYLKDNPAIRIEITAHTDGIGSKAYNLKLSQGRANSCADYIIKGGITADRIIAKGSGECCPLEKETTEGGKDNPEVRQKNRRVEFRILE